MPSSSASKKGHDYKNQGRRIIYIKSDNKQVSARQNDTRPTVSYQASPLPELPHLKKQSTADSSPILILH